MTNQNRASNNMFFYYLLAVMGSLSSAGASMTLLALSASFYTYDPEGTASSSIYVLYYLGIGIIGFVGGWILQRFTAIILGIASALMSALIVFYLSSLPQIPLVIGLPAVFFIFLLSGIDHPNTLRFFNEVLEEKKKMSFFSFKEGSTYVLSLIAPTLAAFIITIWGTRICFLIDGITYVISCLPWLILKKRGIQFAQDRISAKPSWLIGFKLLLQDPNIRSLNISRILNNLAYVTWTTALPLFLAKVAQGNTALFAEGQGIATSLVSAGFILASLLGIWFAKHPKIMPSLVWGASLLGFSSVVLLSLSFFQSNSLYVSAVLLGIGTYCFRITGMTLGQAFTPEKMLGAVIIAGDTVVRTWSFFVSLAVIGIFRLHESWELSTSALGVLMIVLPGFSLFSPFVIEKLAKTFVERNQIQEKKESPVTTI